MATLQLSARRLILAGGFAVAVAAAPVVAVFAVPASSPAAPVACPTGEEEDLFTGICVPHTVPNSGFSTPLGNPNIPEINGIPCTGGDTGKCIGLAESQGPAFVPPQSTVSSSP